MRDVPVVRAVRAVRPDGTREQQLQFVRLLCDKLELVRGERETEERMQALRQLSEAMAPWKPQKTRKAAAHAAQALHEYPGLVRGCCWRWLVRSLLWVCTKDMRLSRLLI